MKVLLVDKSVIEMKRIANIMKRNMREIEITGYSSEKKDTLANIEKNCPDVVVISRELEYESGFSVAEKIRSNYPNLPMIMYSLEESIGDLKIIGITNERFYFSTNNEE